jgi:hypothetical protein
MLPRFPMCSPRVFPIAPPFNLICFAQSPPLLTYIGGPKGEALHLSIKSFILGASIVSTFFCYGPIELSHCQKKSWTCERLIGTPVLKKGYICQKWWRTLLGIEISCSQWEGPSMHSRCFAFLPFKFGGGGGLWKGFLFIFLWFPMCSPTCSL